MMIVQFHTVKQSLDRSDETLLKQLIKLCGSLQIMAGWKASYLVPLNKVKGQLLH